MPADAPCCTALHCTATDHPIGSCHIVHSCASRPRHQLRVGLQVHRIGGWKARLFNHAFQVKLRRLNDGYPSAKVCPAFVTLPGPRRTHGLPLAWLLVL